MISTINVSNISLFNNSFDNNLCNSGNGGAMEIINFDIVQIN